jgi:asparagine synthetase B (glutamine-hydrolysing)
MVFNGVIDMRTKEEMESAWGVKMTTDNDGEIVLRKSELDPFKMLEIISGFGSYSGLVLKVFKDDARLYAMTNGYRPLWILKDGETFFFASTKDIFIRALGDVHPEPLQINTVNEWQITK